uniref:Ig-like domain-containing protein n=1 Tax=Amphilophus citrinellus TaxID=61819 RepID=A0A3Q0SDD5_AMPCI
PWHLLLMLVKSLVTHCCGMASHSYTSICCKSASVVVLVTLAQIAYPNDPLSFQWGWGQDCSNVTFQWKKNGMVLIGKNTSVLVFSDAAVDNNGDYVCSVNSSCFCCESAPYKLTVNSKHPFSGPQNVISQNFKIEESVICYDFRHMYNNIIIIKIIEWGLFYCTVKQKYKSDVESYGAGRQQHGSLSAQSAVVQSCRLITLSSVQSYEWSSFLQEFFSK